MNLLRTGRTSIKSGYLMTREDSSMCSKCGRQLSIKHKITECRKFKFEMEENGVPDHLHEIFDPMEVMTEKNHTFF